jgi:hypothetical protein
VERHRTQLTVIATALLGVLTTALLITGAFVLFGAWVLWRDTGPGDDQVATVGTALVAILTFAVGAVAAIAVRDEWLGRDRGRMLGIVVAFVVVLAVAAALMVGRLHGTEPLFWLGGALAVVTALLLVVRDEPSPTGVSGGAAR